MMIFLYIHHLLSMNDQTAEEIKEGYLEIARAELSIFGVDSLQVKINPDSRLEIEDHLVDQGTFLDQTKWSRPDMKIRSYTLDNGKIIFMPDQELYQEYRNNDALFDEMQLHINEVNLKLNQITSEYNASLRELNDDKTLAQRISPSLAKNYQITESLSDIKGWKVKVILRNSAGPEDPKIGELDQVRYVQIGLTTGTIIPIAMSDEHHQGYDLVHYLISKGLVENDTYYPLCASQNYINADDSQALQAIKTWRKLGGPNAMIKNTGSGNVIFQVTLDDYIKAEGLITINKGELAPVGRKLIDHLKSLSTLVMEARKDERKEKFLYTQAIRTYQYYLTYVLVFETTSAKAIFEQLNIAQATGGEEGIKQLEQLFFGFDSFKNKLHNDVRKALKPNAYSYDKDSMIAIFGDVELAEHELASL